jgi:hypothetical protein
LTSIIKNNITYYTAESPKILIEKNEEKLNLAQNILPELLSITHTMSAKTKIYFYQNESIENALKDIFLKQ